MHLLLVVLIVSFAFTANAEVAAGIVQTNDGRTIYAKNIVRGKGADSIFPCEGELLKYAPKDYVFIADSNICLKVQSDIQEALVQKALTNFQGINTCFVVDSKPEKITALRRFAGGKQNIKVRKADNFAITVYADMTQKGDLRDAKGRFSRDELGFIDIVPSSGKGRCPSFQRLGNQD